MKARSPNPKIEITTGLVLALVAIAAVATWVAAQSRQVPVFEPDPLWAQVRSLAAVSSARYVLAPAGVKVSGAAGARVAAYIMVLADARSGAVLMRMRAQGTPAPTSEAALTSAAATVIASQLGH